MDTKTYVSAKDLAHTFHVGKVAIPALVAATFTIGPRDRIAIIGPSGSGKSTLLHLLAGLERPTTGELFWPSLGSATELRPGKIGFIAQSQTLVSSLSVLENVELSVLFLGRPAKEVRQAATDALERLGLADLADKLPSELSGGQMKQVAAARALAPRPKLVLADEPTGQLDHLTAGTFLDAVFAFIEDGDTALVVTTHDQEVARLMGTVWSMDRGLLDTRSR